MRFKTDIAYPDGKDFIFTIFDDTDVATLGNIQPIYDFLSSVGIYTTKSVWPLNSDCRDSDYLGSHTLEHDAYRNYIVTLADKGFEIGFHGASMESSLREETIRGMEFIKEVVGYYPRVYACHAVNNENMYWGENRFSYMLSKYIYNILSKDRRIYQGENESSPHFWGDICCKNISYVRTFTFNEINLRNVMPLPVYKDKSKRYLNYCFISSDTDNVEEFNMFLSTKRQDQLERERGICILTTHFGKGFVKRGVLNDKTKQLIVQLSKRNGWFVPVSTVLDFLVAYESDIAIDDYAKFNLEMKWFASSVMRRFRQKRYEKTEIDYLSEED